MEFYKLKNQKPSGTSVTPDGFFIIGNIMKLKTNQGDEFLIDDEDYDLIKDYGWTTMSRKYTRKDGSKRVMKYAQFWYKGKSHLVHRFLLNPGKNMHIDHINNNTMDNRRVNLRICTPSQNHHNTRKIRGRSKYKGVSFHKPASKWMSEIKKHNNKYYLGLFETEEEAALAYDKKSKELHGEHGCTNKDLGLL